MSASRYVQPSEIEEICKCYQCDCETKESGICTLQGEPCKDCFNIARYTHLEPDPNHPAMFIRPAHVVGNPRIRDPNQPPPINARPLLPRPEISEKTANGNGDCLYECLSMALTTTGRSAITVAALRSFVARKQTEDTFAAYRAVSNQEDHTGYECIKKVRTLRGLKNTIQICGAQAGADKCLWGDENTLNIISNSYRIRFAIFDGAGGLAQLVESESVVPVFTIMLRLHRQTEGCEHFNLLTLNGHSLIQPHEWQWLRRRLNV